MRPLHRPLPLLIFAALAMAACADPVDPPPDAGEADTGVTARDAGFEDTGVEARDAGFEDAGVADTGAPDTGETDAGTIDSGPRVIEIEVAYAATVQDALLAELFLTKSSTTRVTVTPDLAGGDQVGGKGEDVITGVGRFAWTPARDIVYAAQQETFDFYEIYLAEAPGSQQFRKLSVEGAGGEAQDWSMSPAQDWLTFAQVPTVGETRGQRFAVSVQAGATPVQISEGSSGIPYWSPTNPELVFQDIIVSANDRDLWHVDLAATPPTRTRLHPGANLGFGGTTAWSPDGSRVALSADETALRVFEPFQVDITDGVPSAAVRLTAGFDANADIVFGEGNMTYDPTGARLAFIADTDTDNLEELFVLDPASPLPAPTTKLNLAFGAAAGADGVDRFIWSSDGTKILYAADHALPGVHELYLTDATGPTGVRVNPPLAQGESIEHERFVRNDSMILYTLYDGTQRRLQVVDIGDGAPSAPVDLGPIHPFFPSARYALSPSQDYTVFHDLEDPPRIHLARLTGTPTVTASFETWQDEFSVQANWCWGPNDELLVIQGDGQLYLVEDKDAGTTVLVSGPLADGGRVTACAFPPSESPR